MVVFRGALNNIFLGILLIQHSYPDPTRGPDPTRHPAPTHKGGAEISILLQQAPPRIV